MAKSSRRTQTLPRERTSLLDNDEKSAANVRITSNQKPSQPPKPQTDQPQKSRPVSLYDNLRGNITGSGTLSSASGAVSVGNLATMNNNGSARTTQMNGGGMRPMDRSPSQALCLTMSTTVPQNVAAVNIAGRHTPTRNSLRHSRMIVQSRTKSVSRKYQPRVMRHHKLGTALVALQTLMGIAVTSLAIWLLVWAPHLRTRDIPYWSGVPLLLSGVVGLLLLCCCRKDYPGKPCGYVHFAVKVVSLFLAVVASVTCFCACVFALLHLVFLSRMTCEPANIVNASCVCHSAENSTDAYRVFRYTDLNCPEVENILGVLLIGSCAANAIAGTVSTWYVLLHWHSRYTNLYSEVKTNDNKPIVIGNKMETTT